nr:ADP,ATP carrier protein 1, mitochondrial-like [Tanacetum cinerariifolium]
MILVGYVQASYGFDGWRGAFRGLVELVVTGDGDGDAVEMVDEHYGASHLHSFIKGNDELIGREEQRGCGLHLVGWVITNSARLASYPIDIASRTMMMTSGKAVKYKSSMDALSQIIKNEGAKSLFMGVGANILRAIVDKLQSIIFGYLIGWGEVLSHFEKEVKEQIKAWSHSTRLACLVGYREALGMAESRMPTAHRCLGVWNVLGRIRARMRWFAMWHGKLARLAAMAYVYSKHTKFESYGCLRIACFRGRMSQEYRLGCGEEPLKNIDNSSDHDSEDEVEPVDNEMANFLVSKRVDYGTNSLLEQ